MSNEALLISAEDADYLKKLAEKVHNTVVACIVVGDAQSLNTLDVLVYGLEEIISKLDQTDYAFDDSSKLRYYQTIGTGLKKFADYAAEAEHISESCNRLVHCIHVLTSIVMPTISSLS